VPVVDSATAQQPAARLSREPMRRRIGDLAGTLGQPSIREHGQMAEQLERRRLDLGGRHQAEDLTRRRALSSPDPLTRRIVTATRPTGTPVCRVTWFTSSPWAISPATTESRSAWLITGSPRCSWSRRS